MNLFQRILRHIFLHVPQEIAAALWRLIIILILLVLYLLRFLFGWLHKKPRKPKRPRCTKVPETVKRKPDPCLYSQTYRMSQGLAVTWNNPDIWVTEPDGTMVDSSQLLADSDYIVNVQIHDASFDPALSTQVRCFYRPWSFNSPDTVPIEVNADGSERIVILHIAPWSQEIAKFKWHTPVQGGHYCIQAQCLHPDDLNTNNNLGQENTNVVAAAANQQINSSVLLINNYNDRRDFRIFADRFIIPEGKTQLKLKTLRKPFRKVERFDLLKKALLTYDIRQSKLQFGGSRGPYLIRYRYEGWDKIKEDTRRGKFPIPQEWNVKVNGISPEDSVVRFSMNPNEQRMVPIVFTIPNNAELGGIHHLNFTAWNDHGKVLGGITFIIQVK